MRYLVTGGNGFTGQHLLSALIHRGDEVVSLDLRAPADENAIPGVEYREGDIRDVSAVASAMQGVDSVIHNASMVRTRRHGEDEVWSVNLDGTRNLLRAARKAGVTRFVYVSSASVVYQGGDIENGDESLPYSERSMAPYADSKIAAERLVLSQNGHQHEDGPAMHTVAIRPHVIFGPGDQRFLPTILDRAKKGKLKTGVGLKPKLSDFTYVDNLIDALLRADERLPDVGGNAYFVTNGEPLSFWEFVNRLLERGGYPKVKHFVPGPVAYAAAAVAEGWAILRHQTKPLEDGLSRFAIRYMCTHHYFNIDRARKDLGYEPKVSLDEGIRRTILADGTLAAFSHDAQNVASRHYDAAGSSAIP